MFSDPITTTPFVGDIAETIFGKISTFSYRGDYSMVSTVRALLAERIGDDSIFLIANTIRGDIKNGNRLANRIYENSYHYTCPDRQSITFIDFRGDETSKEIFEELDRTQFHDGFIQLQDVGHYFNQNKMLVRAFVNEKDRSSIVVVDNMTMKKWHAIQSMIPRFVPWYFVDKPLEDIEIRLLESLIHRYKPEYEKAIEEIAAKYDLRSLKIRNSLAGFEGLFLKKQLRSTRDEINTVLNEIDHLKNRISSYFEQLNGLRTTEYGVVARMQEKDPEDSEIMHLFLNSKSLDLVEVQDSSVKFITKSIISNYDPDMFERLIKNKKSAFYRHWEGKGNYSEYLNKNFTDEDIERLLREIFEKNNMTLRVCAAYRINFGRARVEALSGYPYPEEVLADHVKNMHVEVYACRGNYTEPMEEAARNYKYAEAISLCVASCSNMNMAEANTVSFFMEDILSKNAGKYIQLSDGTCVTPLEAAMMLRPKEVPEEEHETEEA